jgi:hypothetical protein
MAPHAQHDEAVAVGEITALAREAETARQMPCNITCGRSLPTTSYSNRLSERHRLGQISLT